MSHRQPRRAKQGSHKDPTRGRRWISPAVPLVGAGTLVLLYFIWPGYRDFVDQGWRVVRSGDRAELSSWVKSFGAWGPLLIIGLSIAQTVLFVVPSTLVIIAAVLAYGPWWGGLLALGAILLSAGLAYTVGWWIGSIGVRRMVGERTETKVCRFVERYGFWGIVAGRLSPVFPHDALSLVAGFATLGAAKFALATAIGAAPLVVLIGYLGESFDRLKTGMIWFGIGAFLAYVIWMIWDARRNVVTRVRSPGHSLSR